MSTISDYFTGTALWRSSPYIILDELSCPENSVIVRLPKATYVNIGNRATINDSFVDATFFIGKTVTGTPTEVVKRACRYDRLPGELTRFVERDNVWLISHDLCLLNGWVAFLVLPTRPKRAIVGTYLMSEPSRMAKLLKEKVIPEMVKYAQVSIVNTFDMTWRRGVQLKSVISDDCIKDILLENIEKTF